MHAVNYDAKTSVKRSEDCAKDGGVELNENLHISKSSSTDGVKETYKKHSKLKKLKKTKKQ